METSVKLFVPQAHRIILLSFILFIAAAAAMLLPAPVDAMRRGGVTPPLLADVAPSVTTRFVTNTADSGVGSLRDTVSASGSGDVVNFSLASLPQTIILTTGNLPISVSLTINGPTTGTLTVSGNNASNIFTINSGTVVEMNNLTLRNANYSGDSGGAMRINSATVNLTSMSFISNTSGPSGGGIAIVGGSLNITNSLFMSNTAGGGGAGLYIQSGSAVLTNTSLTGNQVYVNGGVGGAISASYAGDDRRQHREQPGAGQWQRRRLLRTMVRRSSTV
jgi:predicted outer membrane repeat protein